MIDVVNIAHILFGIATLSIGSALIFGLLKTRQQYPWISALFGIFFLSAGAARLLRFTLGGVAGADTIAAILDIITGITALCTAIIIWPLVFRSLDLPSYNEVVELNQKLMSARQLFESFMYHLPAVALIRDKDGRIRFVNKAWEQSAGMSRREVIGKTDMTWMLPKDIEEIRQTDKQVLDSGEALEYVTNLTVPSGEDKKWIVIKFPVVTNDEHLVGTISIDMSQEVAAERQRAASQAKIEELNRELTARVQELRESNKALQTARDEAVTASSLKSSFVANISHELRTPLTGIIGMNELLMDTELSEEQKSMAEIVQESARVLLAVVNDILDLAKIEAGKVTLEASPFNASLLVSDSVKLLAPAAAAKHLNLNVVVDSKIPPFLYGDMSRLKQILLNLIGNAVKFTDTGTVEVRATLTHLVPGRATVTFAVTDTGIGIDEKGQKLLFTPFTQVDSSSTRKHGGTGLGLVISKRLVEMMGGTLGFESKLNRGSRFWFKIPFDTKPSEQQAASNRAGASSGQSTINASLSGNRKVLVVEDSPVLVELALRQLTILGVQADAVSSGKEAVEYALSGRYSAVLMDVNLPDITGHEAATEIRAVEHHENLKAIPIIAMTAGAMLGDRERALASGMNDYLSKPVSLDALKAALENAFGDNSSDANLNDGVNTNGKAPGGTANSAPQTDSAIIKPTTNRGLSA